MPVNHCDKTLPQKEPDRMQQSQAGAAGILQNRLLVSLIYCL